MTYPLIGNTGVCYDDMESSKGMRHGCIALENYPESPAIFEARITIQHFFETSDISVSVVSIQEPLQKF